DRSSHAVLVGAESGAEDVEQRPLAHQHVARTLDDTAGIGSLLCGGRASPGAGRMRGAELHSHCALAPGKSPGNARAMATQLHAKIAHYPVGPAPHRMVGWWPVARMRVCPTCLLGSTTAVALHGSRMGLAHGRGHALAPCRTEAAPVARSGRAHPGGARRVV